MKIIISFLLLAFFIPAHGDMLKNAISSDLRSEKNISRDVYRNPFQTLSFFGIKPAMKVIELSPGSGWYTEILSQYLYEEGELVAAHFNSEKGGFQKRSRLAFEDKMRSNSAYSRVKIVNIDSIYSNQSDVDAVLTFRNLHNWVGPTMNAIFKNSFAALKPGGILGIVEHRSNKDLPLSQIKETGYFPEALAIKEAEKHGFIFIAKSEINANSKDIKNYPKGVWTLPPVMRLKKVNAKKYIEIGESDRFTLLFKKP
jgi:predicted methyltransferase